MANTKNSHRNEQEIDYYHRACLYWIEMHRVVYAYCISYALNICSTSSHQITEKIVFSFIYSQKLLATSLHTCALDIFVYVVQFKTNQTMCTTNLKYSIYVNTLYWIYLWVWCNGLNPFLSFFLFLFGFWSDFEEVFVVTLKNVWTGHISHWHRSMNSVKIISNRCVC